MRKDIQDLAWSALPKEFKEEVKKEYLVHHESGDMKYSYGYSDALTDFFGEHNLTSDAEEDEMLTVPRKDIVKIFAGQTEVQKSLSVESIGHHVAAAQTEVLYNLFGSKCLLEDSSKSFGELLGIMNDLVNKIIDKLDSKTAEPEPAEPSSQNPPENCDKANHISTDDNKPFEAKFKVGDKVRIVKDLYHGNKYKNDVTEIVYVDDDPLCPYKVDIYDEKYGGGLWYSESALEHYTEPKFKVGEKVMHKGVLRVIDLIDTVTHSYHLSNGNYYAEWVDESDLEPCTEAGEYVNLSQKNVNCDKEFDTILKDSFRNERRLNIAVQILSGIVASSKPCKHPIKRALELTDALIGECEKGGSDV